MLNEIFFLNGKPYKQVNKTIAEKYYNFGAPVLLQSSNMQLNNVWQQPCYISNKESNETFKQICNNYMYYNCDNYRGKYIHYFIELSK